MKFTRLIAAAFAALFAVATPALAAPATHDIDTVQPVGFTQAGFGYPYTATYGQTFTVGASETVLDGFSLFLNVNQLGPVNFKGYVFAWDGLKASGSALFASDVRSFGNPSWDPEEFHFDTGGVQLTGGQQYVAFLSRTDVAQDDPSGASYNGMPISDFFASSYDGGNLVFAYNYDDFGALTTDDWAQDVDGADFWFQADFSPAAVTQPVPEPDAWAMMIGGFALVGLAARKRRRTDVASRLARA